MRYHNPLLGRAGLAVSAVTLATACADPIPMQPGLLAPNAVQLSLNVTVAADVGTVLAVTINYHRKNGQPVVLLDTLRLDVGFDARAVPIALDIGPCLADADHEVPPAAASSSAPGCLLYISASLIDAAGRVLDQISLPGITARGGEQLRSDITVGRLKTSVVVVAAGAQHVCRTMRVPGGGTTCWGANNFGQLGTSGNNSSTQVAAQNAPDFIQLVSGASHTCGLTADGTAFCWGSNDAGQLGQPATPNQGSASVRAVQTSLKFTEIAAGNDFTCGLLADGRAFCWGNGTSGALGDGTNTSHSAPALVTPVADRPFKRLFAGGNVACVLTTGSPYCWGDGGSVRSNRPALLPGTSAQVASRDVTLLTTIAAGNAHACGLLTDGQAYCVGKNESGQLGDGTRINADSTPVSPTLGVIKFVSITAGASHTCGVATDGKTYCWGLNSSGQLGIGTTTTALTPQAVQAPTGVSFAAVFAGQNSTCGVTGTQVYCWGANAFGQLGDGTTVNKTVPTLVK
jgi:alpha-tubulin suppressor-like RCC1 family protein